MKSLYIASQQPLELDGIPLIDKCQIVPQLPELIHVTYVFAGVTYEYDVPRDGDYDGKPKYHLGGIVVTEAFTTSITIRWRYAVGGSDWIISYNREDTGDDILAYTSNVDADYPIFDTWYYYVGLEVESLVTTETAIKQGWQFTFSQDGTIDTYNVKKGDVIRALIDNPTSITDWNIESNSFPTGDFNDYYTKPETDTLLETNLNDAKSYADNLVVGLLDDRGNYDASSNLFPSTGGSGTAGAIKKGDLWTISVNGTLGGVAVTVGDVVRALTDAPGQTSTNWVVTENNLGFIPENSANKATTVTGNETSNTKFGTVKAIVDYVVGFFVPQTRTINGYDLSTNRTLNASDVGAQPTLTDVNFGTFSNGLTAKTTPVDTDTINLSDSADSNKAKKLSFTNLKSFLKTYFDTVYTAANLGLFISKLTTPTANHTGTISRTILVTHTLPANTLNGSDFIEIANKISRNSSGTSSITIEILFNSTNSLLDATSIASYSMATGVKTVPLIRQHISTDGTTLWIYNGSNFSDETTTGASDYASYTLPSLSGTIYFFVAVTLGNIGDSCKVYSSIFKRC